MISTNLSSVFYVTKKALQYMLPNQSGHIINISSMWGTVGASCEVAYSATKSGIHGLTRALAKELAPSNIQVNAIACGVIDTRMNACFDDEERTELELSGLDPDELEFMDPDERREVLEDAGLDPDEYDF